MHSFIFRLQWPLKLFLSWIQQKSRDPSKPRNPSKIRDSSKTPESHQNHEIPQTPKSIQTVGSLKNRGIHPSWDPSKPWNTTVRIPPKPKDPYENP